ncbi:MAG: hypothetical protein R2706_13470 [Acidimicrobiales bacterium]
MPDSLVAPVARRLGIDADVTTTTGSKLAKKQLDAAGGRRTAFAGPCRADTAASVPLGGAPALVGVVGVDGDELLIDDRASTPRSGWAGPPTRRGPPVGWRNNSMITVRSGQSVRWEEVVPNIVAEGIKGYNTPAGTPVCRQRRLGWPGQFENVLKARRVEGVGHRLQHQCKGCVWVDPTRRSV